MITLAKEYPRSLAECVPLRQALGQGLASEEPDMISAEASSFEEDSSPPVTIPENENPKPDRTEDPNVKYFDLLIHGESVGFRGDTYRLVGSPLYPGKLLVNDKPLAVHEEDGAYVAKILNFVTFRIRVLTQGRAKAKREIGVRLHVQWKHPGYK